MRAPGPLSTVDHYSEPYARMQSPFFVELCFFLPHSPWPPLLNNPLLSQTLKGHLRPKSLPAPRALHSTARLANQKEHPFSFLPANSLEPKAARTKGLTEIRGPYYAPVTKTYLDELLSDWGEYVDGIKFAGGAFSLMPEERLRGLIDTAHKHGKSS